MTGAFDNEGGAIVKTLNAHMSYSDRQIIEKGIHNESSKKSIADTIGKDPSIIAKEIRIHRYKSYSCSLALECSNYKKCEHNRLCNSKCLDYVPFKCKNPHLQTVGNKSFI